MVVTWMMADIEKGNFLKGLLKRAITNFPNCFGSFENSNISKCMCWWKKRDEILSDTDFDFLVHRVTKKKRGSNSTRESTCVRKLVNVKVGKGRGRKLGTWGVIVQQHLKQTFEM